LKLFGLSFRVLVACQYPLKLSKNRKLLFLNGKTFKKLFSKNRKIVLK
jgi:hypothetical protein